MIPIPGLTKINDSDTNPDSSSKWFQFWFRFQCVPKRLIPILMPIPASFDSDSNSDSNKPGFDYSDSGIWFRFQNHLQLWYTYYLNNDDLITSYSVSQGFAFSPAVANCTHMTPGMREHYPSIETILTFTLAVGLLLAVMLLKGQVKLLQGLYMREWQRWYMICGWRTSAA